MEEWTYELVGRRKKRARKVPPLTEAALRKAAQRYVERYGGPTASVRASLNRKVRKSRETPGFSQEKASQWVDTVLRDLTDAGALNDLHWAKERARALFERGFSVYRIRQKLVEKRIAADIATDAIETVTVGRPNPDLDAAHAYAARRRIGRYRPVDREEFAKKDLAKLARAGFSYGIATKVVYGTDEV